MWDPNERLSDADLAQSIASGMPKSPPNDHLLLKLGGAYLLGAGYTVIRDWIRDGGLEKLKSQGAGGASLADELEKLAKLRSDGVITDAEFEVAKRKLLG